MKKLLSLILVLGMLAGLMTLPALAATDADQALAGKKFRIGAEGTGTYYETLNAAMAAVTAAGETIVQIADYTHAEKLQNFDKPLTIEGAAKAEGKYSLEFTYTATNDFLRNFSKNVTFKNLNVESVKGFRPDNENAFVIFENCNVTAAETTWWFCFDKVGQGITLKDSTLTMRQGGSLIDSNSSGMTYVKMENSTIHFPLLANSCCIFNTWGSSLTFDMDATSKLIAEHGNYDAKSVGYIRTTNVAANITWNIAAGAVIEYNAEPGTVGLGIVDCVGPITVNDAGAVWTLGKAALAAGIKMPKITKLGDSTDIAGWKIDGKLYPNNGGKLTATVADAKVSAAPVAIANLSGLTNVAGASIRKENPLGIRFTANVSSALYNELAALGSSVKYGVMIAETSLLSQSEPVFTAESLTVDKQAKYSVVQKSRWATENVEGVYSYRGAYYALEDSKASFNTSYSATAVLIFNYADGSVGYLYADFDATQNSRSLYQVATAAVAAGLTGNTMLDHIVSVGA